MRLPPGTTGFDAPPGTMSDVALRAAMSACYDAARRTSGRVAGVAEPGETPSFHTVLMAYRAARVAVLVHATVPLVAVAAPITAPGTKITFITRPDLAAALTARPALWVLTTEELNTPIEDVDLSALSDKEHALIAQWKPQTVGELAFNYWD
jgi:hypothetical protein